MTFDNQGLPNENDANVNPESDQNVVASSQKENDTDRNLQNYIAEMDSPLGDELHTKFNELRRELFKEIDVINSRLQNIEDNILVLRDRQINFGADPHSPNLAATNGYGSMNGQVGFADTVKVTFSNTRPEPSDTEAVKSRGKQKKSKKKKRANGGENGEDGEIVDIRNYFQLPSGSGGESAQNSERRRAHDTSEAKKKRAREENVDVIGGKNDTDNFKRSM